MEWCFQPGVKLDFRDLPDGYVVTPDDIDLELKRIGTRCARWRSSSSTPPPGRATARTTTSPAAAAWATTPRCTRSAKASGSPGPTHGAGTPPSSTPPAGSPRPATARSSGKATKPGREIGYCHLEKLHNLEALPANGFRFSCFPHKIHAASAGWTRAVAIIDDPEENA
jgi:hypothetical protein